MLFFWAFSVLSSAYAQDNSKSGGTKNTSKTSKSYKKGKRTPAFKPFKVKSKSCVNCNKSRGIGGFLPKMRLRKKSYLTKSFPKKSFKKKSLLKKQYPGNGKIRHFNTQSKCYPINKMKHKNYASKCIPKNKKMKHKNLSNKCYPIVKIKHKDLSNKCYPKIRIKHKDLSTKCLPKPKHIKHKNFDKFCFETTPQIKHKNFHKMSCYPQTIVKHKNFDKMSCNTKVRIKHKNFDKYTCTKGYQIKHKNFDKMSCINPQMKHTSLKKMKVPCDPNLIPKTTNLEKIGKDVKYFFTNHKKFCKLEKRYAGLGAGTLIKTSQGDGVLVDYKVRKKIFHPIKLKVAIPKGSGRDKNDNPKLKIVKIKKTETKEIMIKHLVMEEKFLWLIRIYPEEVKNQDILAKKYLGDSYKPSRPYPKLVDPDKPSIPGN